MNDEQRQVSWHMLTTSFVQKGKREAVGTNVGLYMNVSCRSAYPKRMYSVNSSVLFDVNEGVERLWGLGGWCCGGTRIRRLPMMFSF